MAGVQSIERAFAVLRLLSVQPAGVTEIAERVGLPKSTVARLLSALESEGAVEQVAVGGAYRLGAAIEEMAGGSSQGKSLIAAARPFLLDLSEQTGETSGLDIYEDRRIHFMDMVESTQDVQVRDWTGESGPAHSVSAGIVILAHLDPEVVDDYIAAGLEPMTRNTVTTAQALQARLTQARSAGYAWVFEEFALGINSVAAPVFGPTGVMAALRVHGPTYRFPNPDRTHDIGLIVSGAASRLSQQLRQFAPGT